MKKNYGYWGVYYQSTALSEKTQTRVIDACFDWAAANHLYIGGPAGTDATGDFYCAFQVCSSRPGIRAPKWKARLLLSELHRQICSRGRCLGASVSIFPEPDD